MATIEGKQWVLGNQHMMQDNQVCLDAYSHRPLNSDETIMYVAREQTILGHFILQRPLRKEASLVVNGLQAMGKTVHIITGSDEDTAIRQGTILGIPRESIRFKMTSAEKATCIKALQENKQHRVAMIGDAENDAEAIAASDFGVAMPTDGRANMNRQVADAAFKISSLEPLVAAFEISRQTGMTIRQNLMFSWSYNIAALLLPVGLLIATGIALSPGVGVALMILQTSLILLNTYWFKHQELVCLKDAKDSLPGVESTSYGAMAQRMPKRTNQAEPNQTPLSLVCEEKGAHLEEDSYDMDSRSEALPGSFLNDIRLS